MEGGTFFRQPGKRQPYRHIERRYVVEYVANAYPRRIAAFFNLRLGPVAEHVRAAAPELPEAWFRVWKPYADAVVVTDKFIDVIEAKIRYPRQGLGQLLDYVRRVPYTPELKRFTKNRGVRAYLVIPFSDPEIVKTAQAFGIHVAVFKPPWVLDYMREVGLIP